MHILFGVSTFREDPDSKAETSRLEGELAEEFFNKVKGANKGIDCTEGDMQQ